MIIKENVTVYQCDHCKKKLFVKGAMERHIKWCTHNPENWVACTGCIHISEEQIEINSDERRYAKAFRCKKLDQLVYPKKVEKLGLHKRYSTFDDQIPMPKICEHRTDEIEAYFIKNQ